MYAALVMGTIRGINKTGEDTATVLQLLNKRLRVRAVPGRYSSTIYALFDPRSGELTFPNAGVPLPLLVSAAGCRSLGEGGLPSGMFSGTSYEIHSVGLFPGDAVLFATDGLHELRNEKGDDLSWANCARPGMNAAAVRPMSPWIFSSMRCRASPAPAGATTISPPSR